MQYKDAVLILGAGINGAALARELVLAGLSVVVVDSADLASGATSASSRLIHGGLRYLEYGETQLVRESLSERTRLLQLAPQYVRPLRLFVPVSNRLGGVGRSLRRFLFRRETGTKGAAFAPRGLYLVRAGLWLYDWYSRRSGLPRHGVARVGEEAPVRVATPAYRWLCSFYDAQIRYPERFVVALFSDARKAAVENSVTFRLRTYHDVELRGRMAEVRDRLGQNADLQFEPSAVVNATGAWVDRTLFRLEVPSRRLMGGTKGSHFITSHAGLRQALSDSGLYAEAADGRPVFILPLGEQTLVGTTDEPFEGDPGEAIASEREIEYLLATVNAIVPDVHLTRADVDLHYCGVRPLPYTGGQVPSAVSRRHWLEEHPDAPLPMYSVIGGKLTTCRSLAEQAADRILKRLGLARRRGSRERHLPGGISYPTDARSLLDEQERLTGKLGLGIEQVRAVWGLCGAQTKYSFSDEHGRSDGLPRENIIGTDIPLAFVKDVVLGEWVRRLSDLVERRLMLLYDRRLTYAALRQLAGLLAEDGAIEPDQVEAEARSEAERLRTRFGKRMADEA